MTVSQLSPAFIHLRTHSEYSVIDGTIRINDLVNQIKEFKQPAVALSDLSNMFAFIKFYKTCRQTGVKPIAACDFFLENPLDQQQPFKVLLIAQNHQGYLKLCQLISKSWLENAHFDKGQLKKEWLDDNEGLIMLSGAMQGEIGHALINNKTALAQELCQYWAERFSNRFYIELQRAGFKGEEQYIQSALKLAKDNQLPVVATHPVQFLKTEDFDVHEVRVCIAEGEILGDKSRNQRFTREQYLKNTQEMCDLFSDIPSALQNSIEIAKRCNVVIELGTAKLPDFPTPEGISLDEYLIQLSNEGLRIRMEQLFVDPEERKNQYPIYQERLEKECQVIINMGFPGYFLIVQDFINWGKSNGVPVGPGRGSGAGSLVAFSLGITDLDPIRYDLLFERFLNPERVSMPDFDIDFCQDKRGMVIDYVKERYGRKAVSQIATFGTLGAKAVVRDVGRVLEMPYPLCDGLSKLIPANPADPWSLTRTLKDEPEFKKRYEQEEEVQSIVDLALPLEGLTRNIGMHAGGVLIAPGQLTDFCPLYSQTGNELSVVSQYDKDDIEEAGLVKFDFLGLRNLTILDWAVRYVKEMYESMKEFDISTLTLDDPQTYDLLCQGNTTAVFQIESKGMKELLKKLKPSSFEDIIAVLALYRPGPLESGMVDDFVNRKHGLAEVDYFHDDLKSTLESTYGVIVYQEQVMLISQIIGGYSLGDADLLRRAMGKKKPEEMAKQRETFQKGAEAQGYDGQMAANLFDLMEKFAGYGFNKSHSAAYALIAYQTAWLKRHYPAEFLAATMSSELDDTDKLQIFWKDAQDNGIEFLPLDINRSNYRFEPVKDKHHENGGSSRTINYAMGAIKGAGDAAIENIVKTRQEGGAYKDLYDFCLRIDRKVVNRRTIEALIRAGAFDQLDENRAALLATLAKAIEAAEQASENLNQFSLFGDDSQTIVQEQMGEVKPWSLYDRLLEEKKAIGFYYSDSLFSVWRDEVRRFVPSTLAKIQDSKSIQWTAGVLLGIRSFTFTTDQGEGRVYLLLIDDGTAQLEINCSSEVYEQAQSFLKTDYLLLAQVKVRRTYKGDLRLSAQQLYSLQAAREKVASKLFVVLNKKIPVTDLKILLNPFRGEPENNLPGVSLKFFYQPDENCACELTLGEEWKVRLNDRLIDNLKSRDEIKQIEVQYH